jgi:multidrug efflux pump subunit AcrA (membrane-fusion protein)
MNRRALAGIGALAIAAAALALSDPLGGSPRASATGGAPPALATVRRGELASRVSASGTLGHVARADGTPYQVVNQATGAFTALPGAGRRVRCGHVLYRVADQPVVLLCGRMPAYRSLAEGARGRDVRELNAELVRLGYADRSDLDPSSLDFGPETTAALERLQRHVGADETGVLELGQAVFLPGPLRISKTSATPGANARPGVPVAQATTTRRQVRVDLDASEQSSVKVGDRAQITLPGNRIAHGTVRRIGTVAGAPPQSTAGGPSPTTIPVYIALAHPHVAGRLDQAPVQVQITTAGAKDALIVPVAALLARPGGRYAVETVDGRGERRLVPVTLGLFDDADGVVQVTGRLSAGDRVVVPST